MIKDYLKERNISIYSLAKNTGVAYSTLNDFCNGKVDIENCNFGMIKKLADCLNLTLDEFYKLCSDRVFVHIDKYDLDAEITVKNKRYHAAFEYGGEQVNLDVCKVSEKNAEYINNFAEWNVEDFMDDKFLEGML